MKTFFDRVTEGGQRATARELGARAALVHRAYHGELNVHPELLELCERAWPDFDRAETVRIWLEKYRATQAARRAARLAARRRAARKPARARTLSSRGAARARR